MCHSSRSGSRLTHFLMLAAVIVISPALLRADCPASPHEWEIWRQQISIDLVHAMKESFQAGNLVKTTKPVIDRWNKCQAEGARAIPPVRACLENLSTYAGALSLRTTKNYLSGYRISDASYHRKADLMTEVPAELQAPALLDNVTTFGGLSRAKRYLDELNKSKADDQKLIFFSYKSQHLGTPDNDQAFGRLLVVVPGNPEKWVQYGVPEALRQPVRNVSVVAVEKKADGTQNVYFKDRALIRNSSGRLVPKGRFELGVNVDACMDCHKAGVNPIFPAPGSVGAEELPLIDKVNQRIRTYLPPSFDGNYDPGWFGPGLGTPRPTASAEVLTQRVRQALEKHGEPVSTTQVASVAKHVNCAKCHQSRFLEPLNAPLNAKLVGSFVLGGKMPPKADLAFPERQALLDVVVDDYFATERPENGILMDWLLEKTCVQ